MWPEGLCGPFSVIYPCDGDYEHVKKHPWLCVTYGVYDSVRGTSDRFIYKTEHKEWAEKLCEILNDAWVGAIARKIAEDAKELEGEK